MSTKLKTLTFLGLNRSMGGLLIGAWGETRGVRLAFAGAFVLAVVAVILQQRLLPEETARAGTRPPAERSPLRLFCQSFWALAAAFVLRGLKEFGEPTRKALIMDLAPEGRKAAMFGVYYLIRDVVVSFAAFGGAFLWQASPTVNLLTAFGFGVAGTLWFSVFGRDEQATGR